MESIVRVSRGEWDAFLADHSKLIQRYELLLVQLDNARQEIQGLREKEETQMARSQVIQFNEPTDVVVSESGITTNPAQRETMSCSFCLREILMSARFCDGCGRIVATLRCLCGRQIDRNDNFCTACGRAVTRD
jgi:hypothetical protein